MNTAVARMPRRAAWPTLTVTLLALLGVVGVLLATGSRGAVAARFDLTATPSVISLTAGDSAEVTVMVTARPGFDQTVTLSTTALPPGVWLDLDRRQAPVDGGQASVTGRVRTSSAATAGAVGIGVIGRSGDTSATSLIQLQIQPASVTDPAAPPSPMVSDRASFTVSGSTRGMLRPGGSLPIDLRLVNGNPFVLDVDRLSVSVAGTSKPGCRATNFVIVPYRGGYPLRVPAGRTSTLTSLRVPADHWPQLRLRPQANHPACAGATVQLRYAGTGSAG